MAPTHNQIDSSENVTIKRVLTLTERVLILLFSFLSHPTYKECGSGEVVILIDGWSWTSGILNVWDDIDMMSGVYL